MSISGLIPQLRTTDLAGSIDFYTTKVGLALEFQYSDFYAGKGEHFHLYLETNDVAAVAAALKSNGVRRPGMRILTTVAFTAAATGGFVARAQTGWKRERCI